MRNADWISIEDALETILRHVPGLPAEQVPLDDALGRTLAEPVISPVDQPPWDNSAMDGFAVHASDIRGASETAPVTLRIVDDVRAGGFPAVTVHPGEATRIMTGAPVPTGADSVVRVEHTRPLDPLHVRVFSDGDAGRNIRLRGEDLEAGASVFAPGRLLRSAEIGVLAMIGCTTPSVSRRPRVAVLATGDELVEPDRIADVVAGTHIINSNTPAVSAALRATSCEPVPLGIARDELDDLRTRIAGAMDCDALITTAGASVGEHDLVKDALEAAGCRTLFWRVRIRPGSPFSFGLIERPGRDPLPVFGLPGNPVSVLVTFEILVRPALRRMQGRREIYPAVQRVTLGEAVRSPTGLVRFLRVRLAPGTDGIPRAYLTGPQGSGILTSVAAADALLVMPLDVAELPAGAAARVVPLRDADHADETPGFSSGG
ncbi:MAG TPA: gephyrin-like molybdotransferase Glp [Longimicrobiales bacterium]|nr:gephyrin-like molybdotransferase Glp [Longimicrobiales bacterium]